MTSIIKEFLNDLEFGLKNKDIDSILNLFNSESYWRDLLVLTWNIYTAEGLDQIRKMLYECLSNIEFSNILIEGECIESDDNVLESFFTFETNICKGRGYLRLKNKKVWTILTTMIEIKGYEEMKNETRAKGVDHGVRTNRKSWLESKEEEDRTLGYTTQPYVVIIGGGQAGITLGARLKRLGVPALIIEKNKNPGDSWRNRYKDLYLHDSVWYCHLPYIPFPEHWPIFASKDQLSNWLEMYTKVMELNYWCSSSAKKMSYNNATNTWEVLVENELTGSIVTLRPMHVVIALGVSGYANIPSIPGATDFLGEHHHSSQHLSSESYRGKKCIVLGSNNSAHDIAAALWEHGADVTMIQRSSTTVIKSDSIVKLGLGPLYSEEALNNGITTNKADLILASIPYKIMGNEFQLQIYNEIRSIDQDFYNNLQKVGFLLDFGCDNTGLFMKFLRRGSGYYIDVGASELIINQSIHLHSNVNIKLIKSNSIILTNDVELQADLIVYATGYHSMNSWVANLISPEVAKQVGKVWGLGSNTIKDQGPWEGELRNMWKPTSVKNLWFMGGNLHQCRHYSQFLALQLQARYHNIDTPVYGIPVVSHID